MPTATNRYEPLSDDTVLDFARHAGTSMQRACPRHAQDKAKAESAVKSVERCAMGGRDYRCTQLQRLDGDTSP